MESHALLFTSRPSQCNKSALPILAEKTELPIEDQHSSTVIHNSFLPYHYNRAVRILSRCTLLQSNLPDNAAILRSLSLASNALPPINSTFDEQDTRSPIYFYAAHQFTVMRSEFRQSLGTNTRGLKCSKQTKSLRSSLSCIKNCSTCCTSC